MNNDPKIKSAPRILAGAAKTDITPRLPIRLVGQYYQRVADKIDTRLYANILALEGADGDAAVMVSCDLLAVSRGFTEMVRRKVAAIENTPPVDCIMLSAIHTHTAPYLSRTAMSEFWGSDFELSIKVQSLCTH